MAEREEEFEIVFRKARGFERRPLPTPPRLAGDEVLVRPEYVGICGSDLFLMEGQEGELRLGHEWIGRVTRAGAEAMASFAEGDTVTSSGTLACLGCPRCRAGDTHFCDHAEYLSSDRVGALRSWLVVKSGNLVKVPGALERSQVLHEVVSVAEEGLRLLREHVHPFRGELLVLGGGPIGAMLALVARSHGLIPIVVEKRAHRCAAVKALDIDCVPLGAALLDPGFGARFSLLADATNDGGGDTGGFRHFPYFARKGFVGLMVGKYLRPQEVPVVFNRLGARLVWMRGMPRATLESSVQKWGGEVMRLAGAYISDIFPVDEVDRAFSLAASKESAMKVVIRLPSANRL